MNMRGLFCGAALAASIVGAHTALGQANVKVGHLQCNVAGGLGLIIASSKEMRCRFTTYNGAVQEWYSGTIRKFGLDIGGTNQGVLIWDVFAPTGGPLRGALAGEYIGGAASATVGVGVGANALVAVTAASPGRSITLQPLSTQAQTGLNLAGGVASMSLQLAR